MLINLFEYTNSNYINTLNKTNLHSNGKFASYAINNVTTDGFDVVMQLPASSDMQFNWVALSVKDAVTTQNAP